VEYGTLIELIGRFVDIAGVIVIAGGLLFATVFTVPMLRETDSSTIYARFRRRLGKAILLGLELLVAADIIRTVAVSPTLEGVIVLGVIVLVRTFLRFSLEVELYGRWPWQRTAESTSDQASEPPTA